MSAEHREFMNDTYWRDSDYQKPPIDTLVLGAFWNDLIQQYEYATTKYFSDGQWMPTLSRVREPTYWTSFTLAPEPI